MVPKIPFFPPILEVSVLDGHYALLAFNIAWREKKIKTWSKLLIFFKFFIDFELRVLLSTPLACKQLMYSINLNTSWTSIVYQHYTACWGIKYG